MKYVIAALLLACSITPADAAPKQTSQWTWRGYSSRAAAASAYASAAGLAVIIDTRDPIVSTTGVSTPYVVLAREPMGPWCCAPDNFRPEIRPHRAAVMMWDLISKTSTTRRSGLSSLPDGTSVVWRTYPD